MQKEFCPLYTKSTNNDVQRTHLTIRIRWNKILDPMSPDGTSVYFGTRGAALVLQTEILYLGFAKRGQYFQKVVLKVYPKSVRFFGLRLVDI